MVLKVLELKKDVCLVSKAVRLLGVFGLVGALNLSSTTACIEGIEGTPHRYGIAACAEHESKSDGAVVSPKDSGKKSKSHKGKEKNSDKHKKGSKGHSGKGHSKKEKNHGHNDHHKKAAE